MDASSDERRDSFGPHPAIGRRYEHADLTTHRHRNRRVRRRTMLVEKAVRAIMEHYVQELDVPPETAEDFAREVARRLRTELGDEWSLEEAEEHAFAIAEKLFQELGAGGADDDSRGGEVGGDSGNDGR